MDDSTFWKALFEQNQLVSQLKEISQQEDGKNVPVGTSTQVNIKAKAASNLGDNFMSDTLALEATLENGANYKAFVKVLPTNPYLRLVAHSCGVFDREIFMYADFFPHIHQIRQNAGLEHDEIVLDIPKSYYVKIDKVISLPEDATATPEEPKTVVVLEELKWQGFQMADKFKGADYNHALLALTSLAHYHALTISFVRQHMNTQDGSLSLPENTKFILEKTIFEMQPAEMMHQQMAQHVEFLEIIDRQDLAIWMKELGENITNIIKEDAIQDAGPLACILHGDYWINNMLFQYKDGDFSKPLQNRMVDFQVSRIGHAVSDILYFLYSSTTPELRAENLDNLLSYYFETLTKDLNRLGINISEENYTMKHFLQDYRKRSTRFMVVALSIIPAIIDKSTVDLLQEEDPNATEDKFKLGEKTDANPLGISKEIEDKFKSMSNVSIMVNNKMVRDRAVGLIGEVKKLQDN